MKILMLDDSENDITITRRYLPADVELIAVNNKEQFEEAVKSGALPDLIIADWYVPGWAGLAAIQHARKSWPEMPAVILSGTIEDAMIPPLEDEGVDDVVLKDRPHRLGWAIRKVIRDRKRALDLKDAIRQREEEHRKQFELQRKQLIGETASGLAHDLRNMLTPIIGVLHMFEQYTPHEKMSLLRAAQRCSDRIIDLVNRMTTFVSGKNGKKENVSIAAVLIEFLEFLPGLMPGVASSSDIRTQTLMTIDPTLVRQVALNFCVNARDAGAHTIHLVAEDVQLVDYHPRIGAAASVSGKFCKIAVQDDGSGVSDDDLPKIFETFFTTKATGTGLGLSTVKGIVQDYGGFVDVTPILPHGSTFAAYFACAPVAAS